METGTVFASNTVMLYKKCFCSEKINKIYNDILFKRISLESGTQQIILCIYDFPQNFFSKEINPDVKSAVIIRLFEMLPQSIERYIYSKSMFSTYLDQIISNLVKSEYKKLYRKAAHEKSILYYLTEKENQYADDSVFENHGYYYGTNSVKKQTNAKQSDSVRLLILALKACHFLDEEHIQILSRITGYAEKDIFVYVQALERSLQKRINRRYELMHRINHSYMMKNRCSVQLLNVNPHSPLFYRISKAYNYYQKIWKHALYLYDMYPPLKPTNKEIAKVLNLTNSQVTYALYRIQNKA